jgi:hypothetical protein
MAEKSTDTLTTHERVSVESLKPSLTPHQNPHGVENCKAEGEKGCYGVIEDEELSPIDFMSIHLDDGNSGQSIPIPFYIPPSISDCIDIAGVSDMSLDPRFLRSFSFDECTESFSYSKTNPK